MIKEDDFWEVEGDATLLDRNGGFLSSCVHASIIDRAKTLLDLIEQRATEPIELQNSSALADEAAMRIFRLDAERTFKGEKHRAIMISVLQRVWTELRDYHQGVGFVVAFFLLFLQECDVVKIVLGLHRYFVPGYFKAAPVAYVRDARVFGKLLVQENLAVGKHIASLVAPEAFASKWFIGMNVHVLTFEALMMFFEALFKKGFEYLFCFGLALVKNREADLLSADVAKALAVLRLDKEHYPNEARAEGCGEDGSLFVRIVEESLEVSIDRFDIEKLRHDVVEEMKAEEEMRKKREAEMQDLSDDEITFSDED